MEGWPVRNKRDCPFPLSLDRGDYNGCGGCDWRWGGAAGLFDGLNGFDEVRHLQELRWAGVMRREVKVRQTKNLGGKWEWEAGQHRPGDFEG